MENMTIAQALRKINKLKGQLKEALEHAAGSVHYFEDTKPAYSFEASLQEADKFRKELIALETRLRCKNAVTLLDFQETSMTLAEATCRLQELRGQIAWLKTLPSLPQAAQDQMERHYDDIANKWMTTVRVHRCDLPEVQRTNLVKSLQDDFDALNDAVESLNHRTKL